VWDGSSSNTSHEPHEPVKVGVVGGTFDPIHLGHVAMAEAAADCAGLEQVLLLPAAVPPHKPGAVAPAADRLEMSRLAVRDHPRLAVSDLELRRPGPSYTVSTLEELGRERPDDELHLVLGWDAARQLASWRDPERVQQLARLVIVSRPGWTAPRAEDLRAAGIEPSRAILCDAPTPNIVATRIRQQVERGSGLEGLVDPKVEDYIRRHQLYSAQPPSYRA
jgi:nicotinate-nucleotide adenylyltransferase